MYETDYWTLLILTNLTVYAYIITSLLLVHTTHQWLVVVWVPKSSTSRSALDQSVQCYDKIIFHMDKYNLYKYMFDFTQSLISIFWLTWRINQHDCITLIAVHNLYIVHSIQLNIKISLDLISTKIWHLLPIAKSVTNSACLLNDDSHDLLLKLLSMYTWYWLHSYCTYRTYCTCINIYLYTYLCIYLYIYI